MNIGERRQAESGQEQPAGQSKADAQRANSVGIVGDQLQ